MTDGKGTVLLLWMHWGYAVQLPHWCFGLALKMLYALYKHVINISSGPEAELMDISILKREGQSSLTYWVWPPLNVLWNGDFSSARLSETINPPHHWTPGWRWNKLLSTRLSFTQHSSGVKLSHRMVHKTPAIASSPSPRQTLLPPSFYRGAKLAWASHTFITH